MHGKFDYSNDEVHELVAQHPGSTTAELAALAGVDVESFTQQFWRHARSAGVGQDPSGAWWTVQDRPALWDLYLRTGRTAFDPNDPGDNLYGSPTRGESAPMTTGLREQVQQLVTPALVAAALPQVVAEAILAAVVTVVVVRGVTLLRSGRTTAPELGSDEERRY